MADVVRTLVIVTGENECKLWMKKLIDGRRICILLEFMVKLGHSFASGFMDIPCLNLMKW
jgi:hypothetical protein